MTTTVAVPRPNALNRAARIVLFAVLAIVVYAIVLWVALQQSWLTGSDALPSNQAFGVAIQQTINALSIGAIYALIALGYTMVYGIIELINFAHGDVFMVSAFLAMGVTVVIFGQVPGSDITNIPFLILVLAVALLLVMPATGLLNMAIERVFYRPFRGGNRLAPLITAIGVSFILEDIGLAWKGPNYVNFPDVMPHSDAFAIGAIDFQWNKMIVLIITVPVLLVLLWLVQKTRQGKAMRATAQDMDASAIMGIDVNRTISFTFMIAGCLAGAAGLLYSLYVTTVRFDQGFQLGLIAFTSAVLGGIGNLPGAVLGAILIGLIQAFNEGLN